MLNLISFLLTLYRKNTMNESLVSVILPTHNPNKEWIEASINSVLKQNYQNFELFIIDDASTNWVLATMQEFISSDSRIRIIRNPKNLHLVQTLNTWISQAKGKYIARIDHDDIWSDSSKLQKQVDFLENNSEYWLCGTGLTTMDLQGNLLDRVPVRTSDTEIRKYILRDSQFAHPSVLIRKSALDAVWFYDPEWNYVEDYELWLRIGKSYRFANLTDNCLYYRINPNGMSGTKSFKQRKMWLLLTWKYRNDYSGFYSAIILKVPYVFLPRKVSQFILRLIKK